VWFRDPSNSHSLTSLPLDSPPRTLSLLTPSHVTIKLPIRKNHQHGTHGSLVFAANPDSSGFCCVKAVIEFACNAFPHLRRGVPLFYTGLFPISWHRIRSVLHEFAKLTHLDPKRLVPYSARYGVLCNLISNGVPSEERRAQGGWTSDAGPSPYWRQTFSRASKLAPILYDSHAGKVEEVCAIYATSDSVADSVSAISNLRSSRPSS
jgi:hypothetical protein